MIENQIQFLNVDVDIFSKFALDELFTFFESQMIKMYCGEHNDDMFLLAMEHEEVNLERETPDQLINRICEVFEDLPEEAKAILKKVETIKFDLGYNSGDEPNNHRDTISNKTLKRLVALNAELALTIYSTVKNRRTKKST